MSDGAFSGAMLISEQLSIYRFLDGLEQNRGRATENAELRSRLAGLAQSYERLALENQALRNSLQTMANNQTQDAAYIARLERDRTELNRAKAGLEQRNEDQRLKLLDATTRLAVLDQVMREQFPDSYRYL